MRLRTKIASGLVAAAAVATGAFSLIPQASAADICTGSRIIICVDTFASHGYAQGYASIADTRDDGHAYHVAVSNMSVQRWYSGRWVTLTRANDYDGPHNYEDQVETDHVRCNSAAHRTKVLVKWKADGSSVWNSAWKYSSYKRC